MMVPKLVTAAALVVLLIAAGAGEAMDAVPLATNARLIDGRIVRDVTNGNCEIDSEQRWYESHLAIERVREKWYWEEVAWLKSEASGSRRAPLRKVLVEVQSKVPNYGEMIHKWFMGLQDDAEDAIMKAITVGGSKDGGKIYSGSTAFQSVEIGQLRLRSDEKGQYLKLDGFLQSSSADEALYHESIVHPAMVAHPGTPKRVLIGGGGEGAVLREVLKYPSVEKVLMVDIDKEFVDICRKHLGTYHAGSFDDPRVELHFGDARSYYAALELEEKKAESIGKKNGSNELSEQWDVVILDFPDFLPVYVGYMLGQLYSYEFYAAVRRRLAPGGIVITQGGSFEMATIQNTIKHAFAHVASSGTVMLTYPVQTWFLASDGADVAALGGAEVDARLRDRIGTDAAANLKWYDGAAHDRMFALGSSITEHGYFDQYDCIIVDRTDVNNNGDEL